MLVPMAVVKCVAVAVVDVVDMVAVGNGLVTTARTVLVFVVLMGDVLFRYTFIPMAVVLAVGVTVVDVVDVVAVWHGFVATVWPMGVGVVVVFSAGEAHGVFLLFERDRGHRSRCD